MNLESFRELMQTVIATCTVIGLMLGGVGWLHSRAKKAFAEEVRGCLDSIRPQLAELKPNGGGSLVDAVNRIDAELVRMSSMQRLLIGVTNGAVWETDSDGRCIYASPALCDMFGLTREEMSGNGWTAAIHTQQQRSDALKEWQNSVQNGLPYSADYIVRNPRTGERFIAKTEGHPITNSKGVAVGFIGTVERVRSVPVTGVSTSIAGMNA